MIRLLAYSSIIFLIIMQVYVNESKPIFIPSAFLERAWPKDLNYPIERIVCQMIILKSKDFI